MLSNTRNSSDFYGVKQRSQCDMGKEKEVRKKGREEERTLEPSLCMAS